MALVDKLTPYPHDEHSGVRDVLLPWLENPSWSPNELWGFLRGAHLRTRPHGEDPWLSIYRALLDPESKTIPLTTKAVLIPRLTHLLANQPDIKLRSPEPHVDLENLFSLANAAGDPEFHPMLVLPVAEALHDIYARRLARGPLPTNCQVPFTLAVARTQVDDRYFQPWTRLAAGETHPVLGTPGAVSIGIQGIIRIPTGLEDFGKPDLSMVELGLQHLVHHLEHGTYPGLGGELTQADAFNQVVKESVMGPFPKLNWPRTIHGMSGLPDWARNAAEEEHFTPHIRHPVKIIQPGRYFKH